MNGKYHNNFHQDMKKGTAGSFTATIEIIGVNPYVLLPEDVLQSIFKDAGKDKGKIPVRMKIDGHTFMQTLVKYAGHWRLYLNMPMRKAAGKQTGDSATFEVAYDDQPRIMPFHPKLQQALDDNPQATAIFDGLSPSLQLEIKRYFTFLKSEAAIERNANRAIQFLLGNGRFVGRSLK